MKRVVGAVVCALAFAAFAAAADETPNKIYECKDANGNVVYQGEPCLAPAAKPKGGPAAPKSAARPKPSPPPAAAHAATPVRRPSVAASRDVKGATPESVLRAFVAAIQAGDRQAALSCLTGPARERLGPDAAALPLESLRATVGAFTTYIAEGDLGPYWSIRALRPGDRPKWILFARSSSGEWKISGF